MNKWDKILLAIGWSLLAVVTGLCVIIAVKRLYQADTQPQTYRAINIPTPVETALSKPTRAPASPKPTEPSDSEIVMELKDDFKAAPVPTATPADAEEAEPEPEKQYAGYYELTAYIETGNPCADGVYPTTGYTAASNDPTLWHKWIFIEGYGTYYVHDTGGMANNVIDLFVGSYDEAIQFGRREANVYILNY